METDNKWNSDLTILLIGLWTYTVGIFSGSWIQNWERYTYWMTYTSGQSSGMVPEMVKGKSIELPLAQEKYCHKLYGIQMELQTSYTEILKIYRFLGQ